MILVDTSVWVAFLRNGDKALAAALDSGDVYCHPFVIGELACGNIANRRAVLTLLTDLPQATVIANDEVMDYIESHSLMGKGIGFVDASLLPSCVRTPNTALWTFDNRLAALATQLGLAHSA